jgi:hypothetical protein
VTRLKRAFDGFETNPFAGSKDEDRCHEPGCGCSVCRRQITYATDAVPLISYRTTATLSGGAP